MRVREGGAEGAVPWVLEVPSEPEVEDAVEAWHWPIRVSLLREGGF